MEALTAIHDVPVHLARHAALVACMMWRRRADLAAFRKQALGALEELQRRWQPITEMMRARQGQAVKAVTRDRDIGLLGLLIVLNKWPDTDWARELALGFRAIGEIPWCRAFNEQSADPIANSREPNPHHQASLEMMLESSVSSSIA